MGSDLYYEITDLYTPKKKQENACESIKKPRVSRLSLLTKPQDTPPPRPLMFIATDLNGTA